MQGIEKIDLLPYQDYLTGFIGQNRIFQLSSSSANFIFPQGRGMVGARASRYLTPTKPEDRISISPNFQIKYRSPYRGRNGIASPWQLMEGEFSAAYTMEFLLGFEALAQGLAQNYSGAILDFDDYGRHAGHSRAPLDRKIRVQPTPVRSPYLGFPHVARVLRDAGFVTDDYDGKQGLVGAALHSIVFTPIPAEPIEANIRLFASEPRLPQVDPQRVLLPPVPFYS